ncbi:acetyltransferase [Flavobacterium sp.]|uniref:acetyltransferase n=1 Tax=Flavobacterium sp. TaxID=239 RepID=UPI0028BD2486|nr:acetyltransferase [Flavobacterium sp.]
MKYIFGAGGHGKVIATALQIVDENQDLRFVVDDPVSNIVLEVPIIRTSEITSFHDKDFVVAVGDNAARMEIVESLQAKYFTVIHPSAIVSKSATLGVGTVVMPLAIVNAESVIGKHCIVNSGAVVEHDCILKDFAHLSPNASLAGGVFVDEGAHIGIGAVVLPKVKIGKWAVIGAGAVVLNDVPDYAVVVGNPGKIIKYQDQK